MPVLWPRRSMDDADGVDLLVCRQDGIAGVSSPLFIFYSSFLFKEEEGNDKS